MKPTTARRKWPDERVAKLRLLINDGLSASKIAKALGGGVTRNAVIGKLRRLSLSTPGELRAGLRESRYADVKAAIAAGKCFKDLAVKWGISRPGTTQWCAEHISEEMRNKLAENGRLRTGTRDFDPGARLAVIDLCRKAGWTFDRIGLALGIEGVSVWQWLHRTAPFGIEDAMEDYREDEAA